MKIVRLSYKNSPNITVLFGEEAIRWKIIN